MIMVTIMVKVLNVRDVGSEDTDTQVYIGRMSRWGNPFVINVDGTREECIVKYKEWIQTIPSLMRDLHLLEGKDLVCWCAPLPCHGDVLLDLLDRKRNNLMEKLIS